MEVLASALRKGSSLESLAGACGVNVTSGATGTGPVDATAVGISPVEVEVEVVDEVADVVVDEVADEVVDDEVVDDEVADEVVNEVVDEVDEGCVATGTQEIIKYNREFQLSK